MILAGDTVHPSIWAGGARIIDNVDAPRDRFKIAA
jgi:hypothetical protein